LRDVSNPKGVPRLEFLTTGNFQQQEFGHIHVFAGVIQTGAITSNSYLTGFVSSHRQLSYLAHFIIHKLAFAGTILTLGFRIKYYFFPFQSSNLCKFVRIYNFDYCWKEVL
jgi:hypothetical protein